MKTIVFLAEILLWRSSLGVKIFFSVRLRWQRGKYERIGWRLYKTNHLPFPVYDHAIRYEKLTMAMVRQDDGRIPPGEYQLWEYVQGREVLAICCAQDVIGAMKKFNIGRKSG